MVVLIVEGPDLSGKSYAIEKIGKYFNNGIILKNTYKPKHSNDSEIYDRYWKIIDMLNEYIYEDSGVAILDRFFPSQAVYSVLRGEDELYSNEISNLDNSCSIRNFLYVYLDTPEDVLKQRYDTRGDEHIKKQELQMLKERYDEFYQMSNMRKVKIDTSLDDWLVKIKTEVDNIERKLE